MKNLIEFIKDKSYYFLIGTVVILVFVILVSSCSSKSDSYETIEKNMVSAAKDYYNKKPSLLPKQNGGTTRVTIASLIDSELLKDFKDPKDKKHECTGYVEVTKVDNEYSYAPFLSCAGNYEPSYLSDKVKEEKKDEYGNGVYFVDGEYVYRGDTVNNYASFNKQLWRIIKIDKDGNIKLVLADNTEDSYFFDKAYNVDSKDTSGITTNFLKTNMRKVLNEYYENNFTSDSKAKIVAKDLCIGSYLIKDEFSVSKECSVIRENEKVGLLNPSDYKAASLSDGCTNLNSKECINYNYLASSKFYTWLLNVSSNSTYHGLYLSKTIGRSYASNEKPINPVIYLNGSVITSNGNGTSDNPYIIK